jgi:hypothetical protein
MSEGTKAKTDFFVSDRKEGRWWRREVVRVMTVTAETPPSDSVLASAMTTATKVELEIEGLEWFLNEIEVVGGGRLTRQRVATRLVDGLEGRCFCVIRRGGGRVTRRKKNHGEASRKK